MQTVESMKYLQHWSNSLLDYVNEIEKYLSFWSENIPKNISVEESMSILGRPISFDNKKNEFTLEEIISSAIVANGDPAKLNYIEKTVTINESASLLVRQYYSCLHHILKELGYSHLFAENFQKELNYARLTANVGKNLSTLPD